MVELISLFILSIIYLTYIGVRKKSNQKYANSQVFYIIDREYIRWYSKKKNGWVINKKIASMFEIDATIFILKTEIDKQGITKEEVEKYILFLENYTPSKLNIKTMIVTGISFLGANSLISTILSNSFKDKNILGIFKWILNQFSHNQKEVLTISYLIFIIVAIILIVRALYVFMNTDDLYKDSQRIFILKRVNEIWDYTINDDRIDIVQAKKISEINKKIIFRKLKPSRTKFNEELHEAIGETVEDNFNFILSYFRYIPFKDIKKWLLGMIFPLLFIISSMVMTFVNINILGNDIMFAIIKILLFLTNIFITCMFFIFYFSQLDKYEENISEFIKEKSYEYKLRWVWRIRRKKGSWLAFLIYLIIDIYFVVIQINDIQKIFSNLFKSFLFGVEEIVIFGILLFGVFGRIVRKKLSDSV